MKAFTSQSFSSRSDCIGSMSRHLPPPLPDGSDPELFLLALRVHRRIPMGNCHPGVLRSCISEVEQRLYPVEVVLEELIRCHMIKKYTTAAMYCRLMTPLEISTINLILAALDVSVIPAAYLAVIYNLVMNLPTDSHSVTQVIHVKTDEWKQDWGKIDINYNVGTARWVSYYRRDRFGPTSPNGESSHRNAAAVLLPFLEAYPLERFREVITTKFAAQLHALDHPDGGPPSMPPQHPLVITPFLRQDVNPRSPLTASSSRRSRRIVNDGASEAGVQRDDCSVAEGNDDAIGVEEDRLSPEDSSGSVSSNSDDDDLSFEGDDGYGDDAHDIVAEAEPDVTGDRSSVGSMESVWRQWIDAQLKRVGHTAPSMTPVSSGDIITTTGEPRTTSNHRCSYASLPTSMVAAWALPWMIAFVKDYDATNGGSTGPTNSIVDVRDITSSTAGSLWNANGAALGALCGHPTVAMPQTTDAATSDSPFEIAASCPTVGLMLLHSVQQERLQLSTMLSTYFFGNTTIGSEVPLAPRGVTGLGVVDAPPSPPQDVPVAEGVSHSNGTRHNEDDDDDHHYHQQTPEESLHSRDYVTYTSRSGHRCIRRLPTYLTNPNDPVIRRFTDHFYDIHLRKHFPAKSAVLEDSSLLATSPNALEPASIQTKTAFNDDDESASQQRPPAPTTEWAVPMTPKEQEAKFYELLWHVYHWVDHVPYWLVFHIIRHGYVDGAASVMRLSKYFSQWAHEVSLVEAAGKSSDTSSFTHSSSGGSTVTALVMGESFLPLFQTDRRTRMLKHALAHDDDDDDDKPSSNVVPPMMTNTSMATNFQELEQLLLHVVSVHYPVLLDPLCTGESAPLQGVDVRTTSQKGYIANIQQALQQGEQQKDRTTPWYPDVALYQAALSGVVSTSSNTSAAAATRTPVVPNPRPYFSGEELRRKAIHYAEFAYHASVATKAHRLPPQQDALIRRNIMINNNNNSKSPVSSQQQQSKQHCSMNPPSVLPAFVMSLLAACNQSLSLSLHQPQRRTLLPANGPSARTFPLQEDWSMILRCLSAGRLPPLLRLQFSMTRVPSTLPLPDTWQPSECWSSLLHDPLLDFLRSTATLPAQGPPLPVFPTVPTVGAPTRRFNVPSYADPVLPPGTFTHAAPHTTTGTSMNSASTPQAIPRAAATFKDAVRSTIPKLIPCPTSLEELTLMQRYFIHRRADLHRRLFSVPMPIDMAY